MFAGAFVFLALSYIVTFNIVVRVDADAAESRFHALMSANAPRSAGPYGERVLKMRRADGVDEETLAPLKAKLASAHFASGKFKRGASLYEQALSSRWIQGITALERAAMEDDLARAHIAAKELDKAVEIYALFLNGAGDEAARSENRGVIKAEAFYADRIARASDLFAEALKPTGSPEKVSGSAGGASRRRPQNGRTRRILCDAR